MPEFLGDTIFVVLGGKDHHIQQKVGILMGINCVPLLADIFLYPHESAIHTVSALGLRETFSISVQRHTSIIDDVVSINNPDFDNYLGQMYPAELEIKNTTESNTSASYLDLLLSIGMDGHLSTSLCDIRCDFNFHITNFPFLSSNIQSSQVYGVFISQLKRYAGACSSYEYFILSAARLSFQLLKQGYVRERLKSPSSKCYMKSWDMIIYSDTFHWSDISIIVTLLPNWTLLPFVTLFPYSERFP